MNKNMNNESDLFIFPKSLEKYKTIIEETAKPVILISKTNTLSIKKTQSKFGGIPYFPYDYPVFTGTSRNCKNWTPFCYFIGIQPESC